MLEVRHPRLAGLMKKTKSAKIRVGDELAKGLKREEGMFGTGPEGALKAIQVSYHSTREEVS
jgi:hypothetical protein